ncbi:hypothetical protein [Microcoleus vaginatus]|uniref:hypothetical protein n=1 Tax=Microcoleus vaginatus TaxID=119532 RepID=UPI000308079C
MGVKIGNHLLPNIDRANRSLWVERQAFFIPRKLTVFAQRFNFAPICHRWELVSCRSR